MREVPVELVNDLCTKTLIPNKESSTLRSPDRDIENIFYKLLKEVDKESNDQYPYNIKNSGDKSKMNYIRLNHQLFNTILRYILKLLIVSYKYINIVLVIKYDTTYNIYNINILTSKYIYPMLC